MELSFPPVSVFVTDCFLSASLAQTSVLITYWMGSDLSLKPVDQQQRQLAVRHESIVVFCKVKSRCISQEN